MPRGNPNIVVARKGRTKAGTRLFIQLTDEYGVTADTYNVTLTKIYHDEKQGKILSLGQRYHNTFQGVVPSLKEFNIPEDVTERYAERVKDFKTRFNAGKLIVETSEDFESDPNPFAEKV